MSEEQGFLRPMMANPEDSVTRGVYADWLEERGDARAAFLRLDEATQDAPESRAFLDPDWVAFVTTLGRTFRTGPQDRSFFDCRPEQLPFTDTIGRRGRLVTFASAFRDETAWDAGLAAELRFLTETDWGECAYGAGAMEMHPFACEHDPTQPPLAGAQVLKALKERDFRSAHIPSLDAEYIAYPGYHPSRNEPDNDEIHNDFAEQLLFRYEAEDDLDDEEDSDDEDDPEEFGDHTGTHGLLKSAVVDGKLWYVLLHITPEEHHGMLFSDYVVLFAVGRSKRGHRLIGVVTHQVCHNLCD